jgi:hypothetical protein
MNPTDILVVTPYNMQVRCLRERLPDGVEAGTVDKFQGREAPVVFFSMAAECRDLACEVHRDAGGEPEAAGNALPNSRSDAAGQWALPVCRVGTILSMTWSKSPPCLSTTLQLTHY